MNHPSRRLNPGSLSISFGIERFYCEQRDQPDHRPDFQRHVASSRVCSTS